MKALVTTGVVAVVVIGGMAVIRNTEEVFKETIEVEKQVEVNVLDKRIEEALQAAQASTTAKAQAAYDKVIEAEKKRIEDEVKADYIAEIESTITDPSY